MTIGERIARIRKENNLSQEAFGEALGVTRQAISKWEADANIPDVDKLMTMSRLYGVSVGYILGMEEETTKTVEQEADAGSTGTGAEADETGELTEEQLRMVEEIVKRYLDALPKLKVSHGAEPIKTTPKKKSRKIGKVLGILVVIGLVIYFYNTLGTMKNQYQNLQNNLWQMQNALDRQSSNLAYQIKEILENQNALLVDSGYEIAGFDLMAETVTLSMNAEPKIYAPGMKVYFGTNSDGQELTVEATADGHRYSGQITCALTDSISMFVRIERDGVTETQIMEYLGGMRSGSAPYFSGNGAALMWGDKIGGEITRIEEVLWAFYREDDTVKVGDAKVAKLESVLYINYQEYRVYTLTPDEGKYIRQDNDDLREDVYYSVAIQEDIALREGDTVTFTTRMTDNYGRQFEQIDNHYVIHNGEFDMDDYPMLEDLRRTE